MQFFFFFFMRGERAPKNRDGPSKFSKGGVRKQLNKVRECIRNRFGDQSLKHNSHRHGKLIAKQVLR